ncbi:hypothetical protein JXL19_04255 [bacterium]|nr:hypothetical protein [bacterium]
MHKRKIVITAIFLSAVFCACVSLFFFTPIPVNILGYVLRLKYGISLNAKGFALRPGLEGNIERLSIKRDDGLSARAEVETVNFDGRIGSGFRPEIVDLVFYKPDIALDVMPDAVKNKSSKDRSSGDGHLDANQAFSRLQDIIRKMPYIRKMDIKGGAFSIKISDSLGILELKDAVVEVRDMGADTGGRVFLKGALQVCPPSLLSCTSGQIELTLNLAPLSQVLSGSGHFSLSLSGITIKGVSIEGMRLDCGVFIDAQKISLPDVNMGLNGIQIDGGNIPALKGINIHADIVYDLQRGALSIRGFKAEAPEMGVIDGHMDVCFKEGCSSRAALFTRDFFITGLTEIIGPFLDQGNNLWDVKGRGDASVQLTGMRMQEKWTFEGGLEIKVKDGGFSSNDGTKAGEGIELNVNLDLVYPQPQTTDDKVTFRTHGDIKNGEYLWGTIYKDLSGRSVSWDLSGFFLQTFSV